MKLIEILKSRTGAISKTAVVGFAATMGLFAYNMYDYATSGSAAREQAIRSLSNIMASGGQMPAKYSGININIGNNQFASAEEIAKQNGQLFDGGDSNVEALNNWNIPGGVDPTARGTVNTEVGLGMGANAAALMEGNARAAFNAQQGDTSGVAGSMAQGQAGQEEGKLKSATIAQAKGSSLGSGQASFSGGSNGGANGAAGARVASGPGVKGADRRSSISGEMPGGSSRLVTSSPQLAGAHASSYKGHNLRSRSIGGINSKEGRDLYAHAKHAADTAKNKYRSVNEVGGSFLNDTDKGGLMVFEDGSTSGEETSITDEYDPDNSAVEDDLGNAINKVDTTQKEKEAAHKKLVMGLVSFLLASILACIGIIAFAKQGGYGWIGAAILLASVCIGAGVFIAQCAKYAKKFGADGLSIAGMVVAGVMVAAAAVCMASGKIGEKIAKKGAETAVKKGAGAATLKALAGASPLQSITSSVMDAVNEGQDGLDVGEGKNK